MINLQRFKVAVSAGPAPRSLPPAVAATRPRRVLVADNHELTRAHFAGLLRAEGYATTEVGDGANAVQKIREGAVDIALLEADLPDKTGLEILRESERSAARVRVILCTASWNVNRAVEAMKAGAWDYLTKPFHKSELLRAVDTAVRSLQGFPVQSSWKEREERQRQAQKMEAFGRLAGGVIHDFNNLLTVILGYGDLLRGSLTANGHADRDLLRGYVEQIVRGAEQGTALIGQLLAFGRNRPIECRPVDLNAVVTQLEKMLARLIGENVRIVSRLEAGLGQVQADPSQLEQVIMNLAVNARDAMPQGGQLTLETANLDLAQARPGFLPAGPCVVLTVKDTGAGMSPETRARIFEPFYTTKAQGHGTGLGLTIIANIVESCGGRITVESEVGQGTTFRLFFPRI
jgi:signal transduction histidine kinase